MVDGLVVTQGISQAACTLSRPTHSKRYGKVSLLAGQKQKARHASRASTVRLPQ